MKSGTVIKFNGRTVRFIESTRDFSQVKKIYEVFESPVTDMNEIEWWEDQVRLLGVHYALVQVERHYVSGKIKVLGYQIITDSPVAKERFYGI